MDPCAFDLTHYRELLEAARTGGYDWASFDRPPRVGDVFLRHDVDLSLEAALEMARLEHELGVRATYFLMTEGGFYNLDSHVGHNAQRQLRQWGHAVGLHAVYPRAELDGRFDKLIAWHNPDPSFMSQPVGGAINVMEEPYFTAGHYRSDSNPVLARGCSDDELAAGELEWLQILIHPRSGCTRDRRCARRWSPCSTPSARYLRWACGRDRIDLVVTILVTAAGAPGAAAPCAACAKTGSARCGSSAPTCRSA